ncbi:MAG: hypothetical protein JNM30_14960 [Rhodospirillales bacterium]|nr:hypothetical protein [Rhodospirillales bacterium]
MSVSATSLVRGEADMAWLMDEGALLLVGASDAALPDAGAIAPSGDGASGDIRALSWADGQGQGFVALVTMDNVATLRPDQVEVVKDGAVVAVLAIKRLQLDQQAALKRLAALPGPALGQVWDFLAASLEATTGSADRAQRMSAVLAALLRGASKSDGFIELAGLADDGGMLFEGWSFRLGAGLHDVIVDADHLVRWQGAVGTFARTDLPPAAQAIVCYARGEGRFDAQKMQRVHYRTPEGFRHLTVVEKRWQLAPDKCIPHLREKLGRVSTDAAAMRKLKRACRPRFQGVETVSSFAQPVRASVDLAVTAADAGLFLSGWMLDPRRLIVRVVLRGTDGSYTRIDDQWGRVLRPDVVESHRQDATLAPALSPAASTQRHGFAVFVPRPNAGRAAVAYWLELVLEDETCAFLPFATVESSQDGVADRLLSCLNPRDPAARAIVERHLAPISTAVLRHAAHRAEPVDAVAIGAPRPGDETPRLSIVIAAPDGIDELDINLACLAGEPAAAMAELIVVTGDDQGGDPSGRLDHYARFYGFSGRLATLPGAVGRHQALEHGAGLARGEALLFLSPDVLPRGAGWLGALVRNFRLAERAGLVSPTLLYEDDSIRFAGLPMSEVAPDMPMPASPGRYAGYARRWVEGAAPSEVLAGTSECCLVPRRLFERVGGFARDLASGPHQDVELGMRLRAAGRHCVWVPSVTLYAVDPAQRSTLPPHGAEIARMVDEWSFARTWERRRQRAAAPEEAAE